MIKEFLNDTVDKINVPNAMVGKVRDCFDTRDGKKLLVTTDRLSAFDFHITTIPLKGQVLTQLSEHWFKTTQDICPNHMIDCPDPNIMLCESLTMLPVEIVVRGYLAGSTGTSILTLYKKGQRKMYGVEFPDGMVDNQKLEHPIITPTTKATDHDAPLSAEEILSEGLLDKTVWETVSKYALALFERGQSIASDKGLILADTKYEFGVTSEGVIVIGDELHTPDSSRYWIKESYEARLKEGLPPETLDKDVIRRWVSAQCDPYNDPIPEIPDELRAETSHVYVRVFEMITGQKLMPPITKISAEERVCKIIRALV